MSPNDVLLEIPVGDEEGAVVVRGSVDEDDTPVELGNASDKVVVPVGADSSDDEA